MTTSNAFHYFAQTQAGAAMDPKVHIRSTEFGQYLGEIHRYGLGYRFTPHFHPYVEELIDRLVTGSIEELQGADTEEARDSAGKPVLKDGDPQLKLFELLFTAENYAPSALVEEPYPEKELDFSPCGAYAVYNWELFYHVPLAMAVNLSRNQRFEDAQRWFHYIFDPTDDSAGPTPERFWKVKPLRRTEVDRIEEILTNLATGEDGELLSNTVAAVGAWKDAPFRPHVVARYRQSAFMYKAVMSYLDNLIAWGDALFRQDAPESIDEAIQVYVLAANILGPRPQRIPRRESIRTKTYADLRNALATGGNVAKKLETELPGDALPPPTPRSGDGSLASLRSLGASLYFCVPRSERLLEYWDTVADRLFKIHNSLNLQGIFRQLPLFAPPIDPALLARAAASGVDVAAVISGVNQPLPLVRFQLLLQKASEICQEVKSLGNSLLSAIEKEDSESLALLRAQHERDILERTKVVRYGQWVEAVKAREGLEQSFKNVVERYNYYESLLGHQPAAIAELDDLDETALEQFNLSATEPALTPQSITFDIAPDSEGESSSGVMSVIGSAVAVLPTNRSGAGGQESASGTTAGKSISSHEAAEIKLLEIVHVLQDAAVSIDMIGALLSLIPSTGVDAKPLGVGAGLTIGGINIGNMMQALASSSRGVANSHVSQASNTATTGTYNRRAQEWIFQSNVAVGDINQIYKQWRAAQIREALAEREYCNHKRQIENAQAIERFLTDDNTGKLTNAAFYGWLRREVRGLYAQCFQFAFDIAKKAERALQHELGDPSLSFLQYGYQAGREGLLAGDKLYFDIKRMELAYHELNHREPELTKHISLLNVSPEALMQLRATGRCTVRLDEDLFDLDNAGHYFRRIKSVALSIPSVTGPYTSVSCTLRLLNSSIRIRPDDNNGVDDPYIDAGAEDIRFSRHLGTMESIVTSSAQNDSGMFETNLRDERYLPFEGSGVISEWQLELTDPALRQFDYDTISDVILHMRYTARDGGENLRDAAISSLKKRITAAESAGRVRLVSVRHEFPKAWAAFGSAKATNEGYVPLRIDVRPEHYPYWSRIQSGTTDAKIKEVTLFAEFAATADNSLQVTASALDDHTDATNLMLAFGAIRMAPWPRPPATPPPDPAVTPPALDPVGEWTVELAGPPLKNVWLAIEWTTTFLEED